MTAQESFYGLKNLMTVFAGESWCERPGFREASEVEIIAGSANEHGVLANVQVCDSRLV